MLNLPCLSRSLREFTVRMAQPHAAIKDRQLLQRRLAALGVHQRSQLCVKVGTLHIILKHQRQLQEASLNTLSYLHQSQGIEVLHFTK